MCKVYNFFGFGERIKNWLKSIGTNRTACIILGPSEHSPTFPLEKGHAQGDSPSPLLYNFAAQILLFRIELDPLIKRIYPPPNLPGPVLTGEPFCHECNRETGKCDCFADDNSVMTALDYDALLSLRNILQQFKTLSGLSTNYEKTALMRIGCLGGALSQDIINLGFSVVDKIKLLGFTINNSGNINALNFEPVVEKLANIIRFWERFYLSLPGKLTIYKTLLLPQINYISSVLMPSEHTLNVMADMMEKFVTKGFKIAKKRIYEPAKNGGIGMFDLKNFITALQCGWVKRAFECCNDNWKFDLITYLMGIVIIYEIT
jgi:hypothetical protein